MKTSDEPISRRTPVPPRRQRSSARVAVIATMVGLFLVLVVGGLSALGVRRDLRAGPRRARPRQVGRFVDGDASRRPSANSTSAMDSFRSAGDGRAIDLAHGRRRDPLRGEHGRHRPCHRGRGPPDGRSGLGLADAVDRPAGWSRAPSLPPATGIPIDRFAGLAEAAVRADELTGQALATIERTSTAFVPSAVASATVDAQAELETLHRQLHAAALMLRRLPSFLGSEQPRHYFFGASNPAELRGTGGLIGAYSILTVDCGPDELLGLPPRPVVAAPRRRRRSFTVAGVREELRLLSQAQGLLAEPQHDTGLPAGRSGDLALVPSGDRRDARWCDRGGPFRAEVSDACDDPRSRRANGDRGVRAQRRPLRDERSVRPVRPHERRAEVGARQGRPGRGPRIPRTAGQGRASATGVAQRLLERPREGVERGSPWRRVWHSRAWAAPSTHQEPTSSPS